MRLGQQANSLLALLRRQKCTTHSKRQTTVACQDPTTTKKHLLETRSLAREEVDIARCCATKFPVCHVCTQELYHHQHWRGICKHLPVMAFALRGQKARRQLVMNAAHVAGACSPVW